MDVLCDELVQEILRRLPASAAPSVSLVSKRWLFLLRSCTTSLSLRIPSHLSAADGAPALSSVLGCFPSLAELTIVSNREDDEANGADELLLAIAAAPCSSRLAHLRFLPASQLSPFALVSSAAAFSRLTSLQIASRLPLSFRWLSSLPALKSFSFVRSRSKQSPALAAHGGELSGQAPPDLTSTDNRDYCDSDQSAVRMLPIESLSLSGICADDRCLSWLWYRCAALRWLQLRACDGTGDDPSSPAFPLCLPGLLGLELRTCRSIADRVLLHAADHCRALTSLLIYDGGSSDALHHFIHRRGAALRTLDLRLPLDLNNDHLLAIAADDRLRSASGQSELGHQLAALRLHSCCLVTGDGLRSLARSPAGAAIEELALVNCDVVEREPGLLTFLSQNMLRLQRLDLSHNETFTDKEVGSMLASCRNLMEIRLRGCRALTGVSLTSLLKHCGRQVEVVDVSRCPNISSDAVESLVMNASRLSQLLIEESKLTEAAKLWLSRKAIKIS
ncbi:hypothetical protein Cni_G06140 [Canna indica]|uniref:F-box domain-containing protein n=1 Tax=Canna indica TaxID=4628 RepID=A0AAQ3Q619_9LILI|nr:hypothetical protein Cni_G06140 [Canna indica]